MYFVKKTPLEKRADLQKKLQTKKLIRFPGAYNPLVAKLIEEIGYEGVYVSGAVWLMIWEFLILVLQL